MFSILTEREVNVLTQLTAGEEYGLELVAGSGGLLRRNATYVLFGRMEDKGIIEGRQEVTPQGESGPPRRVYRIIGNGASVLAVHEMRNGALTKDVL
jgi:hypothetical protein